MSDKKNIFLTPGGDDYWNEIERPFRLLRPIEMCTCFLSDEQFISIVTKRGLITLENVRPLLQHVKRILGRHIKSMVLLKLSNYSLIRPSMKQRQEEKESGILKRSKAIEFR
jgi:hypothetical protein